MSKKSLIIGIFIFLLLLLASNASSQVEQIYAGWTVGDRWDDGSGTGSYGTILRSTDSGVTWSRQGAGQIADVHLWSVFAVDPYTAWVVGDPDSDYSTIYHTTDGGSTWMRKGSSNPVATDYVPNVGLSKVHARGDDVWAVGNSGVILHSSDGGVTWMIHFTPEHEIIHLQGVYAVDGNTVWATGGLGDRSAPAKIFKTTDGGETWISQSGDVNDPNYPSGILSISATDAFTAWAVGGEGYAMLRTTDGGATWTKPPNWPYNNIAYQFDLNGVYAVNPSTVWVAGDNNIYWTHDGGENWDDGGHHGLAACGQPHAPGVFFGITAVSAQKAWGTFGGYSGCVANTIDGGTTWTTINQLNGDYLPSMEDISFAIRPIYPDYLIISMIENVEMLVDDGILNKGQGNAIIVKLEKALDRLDDDR